jgi:hypothetical protein
MNLFLTNRGDMELVILVSCALHWKYIWGHSSLACDVSVSSPPVYGGNNKEHFQHLLVSFISNALAYNAVWISVAYLDWRNVHLFPLSTLSGGNLKVTARYLTASLNSASCTETTKVNFEWDYSKHLVTCNALCKAVGGGGGQYEIVYKNSKKEYNFCFWEFAFKFDGEK